jgi:pyrophosphatase PpaX
MTDVNTSETRNDRLTAVEAVLFDLDGTVVDTIPHILASFRHATAEVLGEALSDEVLLHHVGVPLARQMLYFTDDEAQADALLVSYRAFNHRTHDDMARLYPNSLATLTALHDAGMPMGIVTSKSRMMAQRAIDLFDLGRFFRVLVTADDTESHKPDPLPLRHAAELLGMDPGRLVYVGDSPADIACGKGAGAATVGAAWGVASVERLAAAEPDAIIDDIGDLPALLGISAGLSSEAGRHGA